MDALTGPISTTSTPAGEMNLPSDVPPPVDKTGSIPVVSEIAFTAESINLPGLVKKGSPDKCHLSS